MRTLHFIEEAKLELFIKAVGQLARIAFQGGLPALFMACAPID